MPLNRNNEKPKALSNLECEIWINFLLFLAFFEDHKKVYKQKMS